MQGLGMSAVTAYTAHREWAKRPPDERYASVEALHEAIGLRRVGLGFSMLHLQPPAGVFEAVGGEAGSPIRQHVRDLEREGAHRLGQEGDSAGGQLIILDG